MNKFILSIALSLTFSNAFATVDDGFVALNSGNYPAALKEFAPAAQRGDAMAEFGLAFMYEEGKGVPRDPSLAANWYKKAAEGGNVTSALKIGLAYQDGLGVPTDLKQARKWFEIAASKGDAIAAASLGLLCEDGKGGPKDLVKAAYLYRVALGGGEASAAQLLGLLYADGNGVKKNPIIAYALLSQSTEQPLSIKAYMLLLENDMNREEFRHAQDLATRMRKGKVLDELETEERSAAKP